jgi:glycosyltransferase involved in cell wall biosynthesis
VRVLLVNFEMDEDSGVLAWQASVARELAERCELVAVLTRRVGRLTASPKVLVETMPPRRGVADLARWAWRLNAQVFRLCRRHRIDACFVHMAMDFSYLLWPSLRLLGIPILLWYAHGTVSARLRLAHLCATRVVTSTPEGFRLPSGKVRVIGQGVDSALFRPPPPGGDRRNELLTVSRVSRRKRIDLLVSVMERIRATRPDLDLRLRVVGPPLTADDLRYDGELRARIWHLGLQDRVELTGFVPQEYTPDFYRRAFLHVNVSQTGSLDKTVVEALACGCPVLTSNPAFRALLAGYPELVIEDESPAAIAARVVSLYETQSRYDPAALRALVVGRHDVQSYADRVAAELELLAAGGLTS